MRAIGIILAGGNNSRMRELSDKRAIAAMPVAGSYRSIDFVLSNMANSHIQKVAVLTQYNARSLNEHLSSSKWWDFGRKQGGLFVFTPTITKDNGLWYQGTADAIYQNIDFLKESHEPYRMMTSRAEYRLLLRQDNADQRLTEIGYEIGLISQDRYERLKLKEKLIEEEVSRVEHVHVGTSEKVQNLLAQYQSTPLNSGISLAELIRRPELTYQVLATIDEARPEFPKDLSEEVSEQVNISIKYDGYIKRQKKQVEQFKKLENKKIPENIDYDQVKSLRIEAVQKLKKFRPVSIGQASRISGVSPADISVLLVYLGGR